MNSTSSTALVGTQAIDRGAPCTTRTALRRESRPRRPYSAVFVLRQVRRLGASRCLQGWGRSARSGRLAGAGVAVSEGVCVFGCVAEVDGDAAAGVADGDAFFENDGRPGVVVVGGDAAEDGAGHSAQGRRLAYGVAEGAAGVAEHDVVVGDLDEVELAVDSVLEADVAVGELLGGETADESASRAVFGLHLSADSNADVSDDVLADIGAGGVFNGLGELDDKGPQEGLTIKATCWAGFVSAKGAPRRRVVEGRCFETGFGLPAVGRGPGFRRLDGRRPRSPATAG